MRQQTNQRTSHAGKTKINNIGHEATKKQTKELLMPEKTKINNIGHEATNKQTKELLMPEKLK